jgi:hypothetical protein
MGRFGSTPKGVSAVQYRKQTPKVKIEKHSMSDGLSLEKIGGVKVF